ncbi:MAG: SDR family oxidoreductase [Bacteroidota bacterium]
MNVFLTGATGLVGGELLVTLSKRSEIKKVYCFIRASSVDEAVLKIEKIFSLHDDFLDKKKIVPVLGNLQNDFLSESLRENSQLKDVNVVIHAAANTSFSPIYNKLVEDVNIHGLEKILFWAKDLPFLQTFLYVGTATICGKNIQNRLVFEDESPSLTAEHLVRYTYTKTQGELLLNKHLPPEKILIVRPSIIMGDSRKILPRSPIILWAVAVINQLRLLPVTEHAMLDMIPVDYAAEAIAGLLFARRSHNVYHVSSGKKSATSAYKLSLSLSAYFSDLPPFMFLNKSMTGQLKQWCRGRLSPHAELQRYPAYLDYWKEIFPDPGNLRILLAGLEPYLAFMELGQAFDNSRLLQDLPGIKQSIPADTYINNCMEPIANINILEAAFEFC